MSENPRNMIHESVRAIIRSQFGVISRRQALEAGFSERQIDYRLEHEQWRKLFSGIYADTSSALSLRSTLTGLSLWCGEQGAVSHTSAAWLWEMRIPTFKAPTITVSNNRRKPSPDVNVHYCALPLRDVTNLGPIRLTTPSRVLVELAGVLAEEELEICMDDAFRRRLTSPPRLRWQCSTTAGRGKKGSRLINEILAARRGGAAPHSGLETKIGRALRNSDLPQPVAQYSIADRGRFIARVDFAWPDEMVLLECESYTWHSGRQEWRRDTARLNEVVSLGWLALRGTEEDACDPHDLVEKLRRVLRERRRRN
jgi:very-short-patch-repair endonuclease